MPLPQGRGKGLTYAVHVLHVSQNKMYGLLAFRSLDYHITF